MTTQAEMRVTRRRVTKAKGRQLPAEPRKRRGPPWRLIHVVESQRSGPRRRRDWRCPVGVSKQLDTHRMRWLAPFYSKAAEMVKPVGVMSVSGDGHWVDAGQLPSVLTLKSTPQPAPAPAFVTVQSADTLPHAMLLSGEPREWPAQWTPGRLVPGSHVCYAIFHLITRKWSSFFFWLLD